MVTVKREFIKNFTSEEGIYSNKISIIEIGSADMACTISILLKVSYVLCAIGLIKVSLFGGKATAYGCAGCVQARVSGGPSWLNPGTHAPFSCSTQSGLLFPVFMMVSYVISITV